MQSVHDYQSIPFFYLIGQSLLIDNLLIHCKSLPGVRSTIILDE